MRDDVTLNKTAIIDRCLERVREEYRQDPLRLEDQTIEDSIVLNLQRACQAAIDLAMHVVSKKDLGIPQATRDAFTLLKAGDLIDEKLARELQSMVGFRNIAVHEYQALDRRIIQRIIEERLDDFAVFARSMLDA